MAKFKYIAEDAAGVRKEGLKEAASQEEVAQWIVGSGLKPISIGEVRPKKKAEKPTTQDTAKIFITLAEVIKEKAHNCSPLENVSVAEANNRKEELQRGYLIDRLAVEALTKRTKKHLDKDLQETPALLGNDYFTGMINLYDHCRDCAAILTGKTNDTDAYIRCTKAILLSNGVLNRRNLDKAIADKTVRSVKPSKQRLNVHIQDVIVLVDKLLAAEGAPEQAAKMFGTYAQIAHEKTKQSTNLD